MSPDFWHNSRGANFWKSIYSGEWYVDIGYTGLAPGKLHAGINIGFQIGPKGGNFYYGVGLGGGSGTSVTFNPYSLPERGVNAALSVRGGTGVIGVNVNISGTYGKEGTSWDGGFGWGVGSGGAATATHTITLWRRGRK